MGYRADRSGQSGQRGRQPLEADAFSTRLFGDLRRPPTSLPWEAPPLGEPNVCVPPEIVRFKVLWSVTRTYRQLGSKNA